MSSMPPPPARMGLTWSTLDAGGAQKTLGEQDLSRNHGISGSFVGQNFCFLFVPRF